MRFVIIDDDKCGFEYFSSTTKRNDNFGMFYNKCLATLGTCKKGAAREADNYRKSASGLAIS